VLGNDDSDDVGKSDRLDFILAECLKRIESGDAITQLEIANKYPEYKAEVAQFVSSYRTLEQLVTPLRGDVLSEPHEGDDFPAAGEDFAGYQLIELIGRGGMAVVYKARHPRLDRVVALKMVALSSPSAAKRFRLEAQLVATLDHPNIVPIYDVGECDGRPYYTMKLFDGGSLAGALANGHGSIGRNYRRAAELTATVARAVHHAHEHGIFHRDLKPGNILLDGDGQPHVADFGLARQTAMEPGATQSGAIVGTPVYMPPEQAMGRKSGFASADVYSLGAILYELLTGRQVHRASTTIETLLQVIECEPVRPRQIDPGIPRDLETICSKCLEREPERRYQSAAALADDLGRWLGGEPIVARPVGAAERLARWGRRHPTTVWVTTAAMAIGVMAVGIGTVLVQRERAASAEARLLSESDARARIEQQHYFHTITLAARERESGNPGRAEELLAACPPKLRGWEWHYLRRQVLGTPDPLRSSSHLFALAVDSTGRVLAAGGSDGSIDIWDLEWSAQVHLDGHRGRQVRGLAFSKDGKWLASAGWDSRVVLWNVETKKQTRLWEFLDDDGDPLDLFAVAFSPDGNTLAATVGHEIRRFSISTGGEYPPLRGHTNVIRRVAFAPNGEELASIDDDGRLKIWTLSDQRPRLDIKAHPHLIFDLAYSSDGTRLVTAGGQFYMHGDAGQVRIWNANDGSLVREFSANAGAFYAAAFTLDALRVMAGGEDGRVHIWDLASGEEALALRGHVEAIWGLAITGDGLRMYTAGGDHLVRHWDATPLPDPESAAASDSGSHELRVTSTAFDPSGERLVSAGMDGVIHVRNGTTGEVVRSLPPLRGQIHAVVFSPNGEQLASAVWRPYTEPRPDAGIVVRDTKTWEIIAGPQFDTYGSLSLAYSSDGTKLIATTDHGAVLLDTKTWKVVWQKQNSCLVTAVAFGRDEVACADANGIITFRDARTGLVVPETIAAHSGRIVGLAYSPDRTRVASAGIDGAIRVWDLPSRKQVAAMTGHPGGAYGVAFTPDGDRLVSGGNDGQVRVWDVRSGRELRALAGHTDAACAVAVHPSGRTIATGGRDRRVRIWSLPAADK
jgi:WD40 repeat protein/tRNA A-37 threonylcarbamoyl transferase component Bud32